MIPFLQLTPGEDAAAVRAAVARMVRIEAEVERIERAFAGRVAAL